MSKEEGPSIVCRAVMRTKYTGTNPSVSKGKMFTAPLLALYFYRASFLMFSNCA